MNWSGKLNPAMARTFHRKKQFSAISAIDVTPLIDLAFSLLIIFMIAAPLLEQSINLQLPIESVKEQSPKEEQFRSISIDARGDYYWGSQLTTPKELNALLLQASTMPEEPVIRIRADASLSYQQVMNVLDLVKQHHLTKISLDTVAI